MNELNTKCRLAKNSAFDLSLLDTSIKNHALVKMATALERAADLIIVENAKDVSKAREINSPSSVIDRLILNQERIKEMADGLRQVSELSDPIGELIEKWDRPNGIQIEKIRVPFGVVGIIYEGRPNVTTDAIGLCLKTGNAVVLRGSSNSINSNRVIVKVVTDAISGIKDFPAGAVQLVEDTSREAVEGFLKLNGLIDVIIPRGGASLIQTVVKNATVPVIETGAGNCHVYIDESASPLMAKAIIVNAKTQRPSVCNAAETLLVHSEWAKNNLADTISALEEKGVECRGCSKSLALIPRLKVARESDWETEYLDLTIAVKIVESLDEAISHINKYSTNHSEAIVTEHDENAREFLRAIDSAAVYHNVSTRFTDGFEFGFGAEVGISTQKLHARGPMGLKELTSYKYVIRGSGQVRG